MSEEIEQIAQKIKCIEQILQEYSVVSGGLGTCSSWDEFCRNKTGAYYLLSLNKLQKEKSQLQKEKSQLQEEKNLLLTRENLLLAQNASRTGK